MTEQHDPLPWHAKDRGIGWEVHYGPARDDCWTEKPYCNSLTDGFRDTMTQANAELIVAAVNATTDRLAAAREGVVKALEPFATLNDVPITLGNLHDAHAALKELEQAKGGD